MPADILTFPGNPGAPVQPIVPRSEFGQRRQIESLAGCLEGVRDALVRPEDRTAQQRIRALAREARNAFDGGKHVCPSLKSDLAARIRGVAQQLEALSEEAKTYGLLTTRVALNEHAGLLEGEAALVEAG
jgi:hypothetical protein